MRDDAIYNSVSLKAVNYRRWLLIGRHQTTPNFNPE